MEIDILTLFPEMFKGPFDTSMLKKAQDKDLVKISIHNLRDWAKDNHKTVDDRPYGGGTGMILKIDVLDRAISQLKSKKKNTNVILLDLGGNKFTQKDAKRFSLVKNLILIAGHYEGVDYRVHEHIADEVISIGDYVLTGGEIPAMVLTDAVVRLISGVLEKPGATEIESFSELKTRKLLEYPQYTRPELYKHWKVPETLLSGNHKEIEEWRRKESLKRTKQIRPDLLK